jgi:hypothetical protein
MMFVRLVEANQDHPWRRIVVFSGVTWLPLFILTAIDNTLVGSGVEVNFLHDPVPHARYLIALPLLVIAERIIDPYLRVIVQHFDTSGVVSDDARPLYDKALHQLNRRKDAIWVDVVLFLLAFGLSWVLIPVFDLLTLEQRTSSWMLTVTGGEETYKPAGLWFAFVSIPLLQFFVYRWIWRLIIWISFMNKISRIPLVLQPAHPDRSGGLGMLSRGQSAFGIVFAAFGTMMSSTLAQEIIHEGRALTDVGWEVLAYVLICFAIITGPLCTFFSNLLDAKRQGLRAYSALGYRLTDMFNKKWIKTFSKKKGEGLITAVDPSAMADYTAVYETVSTMRLIPLNRQNVIALVLTLVAPFVPLVLTQFSLKEALQRLAQTFL